MNCNLKYFEALANSINKKWGYGLSVLLEQGQIELKSKKGRVYGTSDPSKMDSALKSLKKTGVISHYSFEERKEYQNFIKQETDNGADVKAAHKKYFLNLI